MDASWACPKQQEIMWPVSRDIGPGDIPSHLGGECRRIVQSNGRWHSTCAQVPWTDLTSSSAGLQWRTPSNTGGLAITSYSGGKARQALAVIGQGLHYKGRSDHLWLGLLTGGIRLPLLGSGSKRRGPGPFVEMSQAVMPVKEPGMFVLYFPVFQA